MTRLTLKLLDARLKAVETKVSANPAFTISPPTATLANQTSVQIGQPITLDPPAPPIPSDGEIIGNTIPNKMPPVPPEFGVGAVVEITGTSIRTVVRQVGDGVVQVVLKDGDEDKLVFAPWKQFTLITPAP
jgi:hypothetical protein